MKEEKIYLTQPLHSLVPSGDKLHKLNLKRMFFEEYSQIVRPNLWSLINMFSIPPLAREKIMSYLFFFLT